MSAVSLRLRLSLFFAGAVILSLALFTTAVVVLLAADDDESDRAAAEADLRDDVRRVLSAVAIVGPFAVAGSAALGYGLARRSLKPLRDASERAKVASHSKLDLELPLSGRGDEWDELATTMNTLLGAARASLGRVRRFTADAAHELRTPLTGIMGEAEVALRRDRDASELRASLEVIHGEARRMAGLLERLLTLARADSERLLENIEPVPLAQVIDEATAEASRIASQLGRPLHVTYQGPQLSLHGDRALLLRALGNLVENAVRHGGPNVRIEAVVIGARAELEISDDGPGISPELAPLLFERFSRGDPARTRGGTGLGLSIARAIAEAHHGTLVLSGSGPGARFKLTLPLSTST